MAETENNVVTEEKVPESDKKKKTRKEKAKSDKPSLGSRISKFFKDYKSEFKKIVWFSKEQTIKSTGLVIVCLVVVSAVISLLDLGLNTVIMWLGKLI